MTEFPCPCPGVCTGQAKSRPKPPAQNLDEMDAGTDGLDQAFLQIKKNDQELDQELDLVHQGVKRLGVMATVSDSHSIAARRGALMY